MRTSIWLRDSDDHWSADVGERYVLAVWCTARGGWQWDAFDRSTDTDDPAIGGTASDWAEAKLLAEIWAAGQPDNGGFVADGVVKRQAATPDQCRAILDALVPYKDDTYESRIGGRYFRGLHDAPAVHDFVRQAELEALGRDVLGEAGPLGYLSLSALEVRPGEAGIGAHRDWPHGQDDADDKPHMSAQYILSLDGTDGYRAPLWLRNPANVVVLAPGELLSFGGNIRHGTLANQGDRRRTSLLWSIGPVWVRPMIGELWNWMTGPALQSA